MNGQSPSDYVLSAFKDVHSNDLEQTLLVCLDLHFYSLFSILMQKYNTYRTNFFGLSLFFICLQLFLIISLDDQKPT